MLQKNHIAIALIFNKEEYGKQILLQKKSRSWRGIDVWTPFGGSTEAGENPIDAIQREVREEIGIETLHSDYNFITEATTTSRDGVEIPLHVFSLHWNNNIEDITIGEGCGVAFWYEDEIPNLPMLDNEKVIVQKLLKEIS